MRTLRRLLSRSRPPAASGPPCRTAAPPEPLSHPSLAAMTPDQLADLPLPRRGLRAVAGET